MTQEVAPFFLENFDAITPRGVASARLRLRIMTEEKTERCMTDSAANFR